MKKIYFILTIMFVLAPIISTAGIRVPNSVITNEPIFANECSIGIIAPSYVEEGDKLILNASIFIKSNDNKAVADAEVSVGWRGRGPGNILADGSCTTGEDGICSVQYETELTEKLPEIGVRVLGVDCPDLKYVYMDNSGFAWVIYNLVDF